MEKTTILIDNCAWDELMLRGVDLVQEQKADLRFTISTYGLQEVPSADHERDEARATSAYVGRQIEALELKPVQWLVLGDLESKANEGAGLGDLQPDGTISGGGYMTSVEGREFAQDNTMHKKVGGESGSKLMGSGLLKNQIDVDYGEWSMGLPLVTLNVKDFRHAGKIIDLNRWKDGAFGEFIRRELKNL
ncbi:hypothetical protein [Pseudomonas putida]|uniref:hypothetical protein n=1 Tax=Pseudomonas putida TaxID=303 RepID=UPI002164D8BD|nr:hypothetical protein [Pseudomonas putida]